MRKASPARRMASQPVSFSFCHSCIYCCTVVLHMRRDCVHRRKARAVDRRLPRTTGDPGLQGTTSSSASTTKQQAMPPAGRRRRSLDSSLAVAAVGALSATFAFAFTTPLAPQSSSGGGGTSGTRSCSPFLGGGQHHDRYQLSALHPRQQQQRRHRVCGASRDSPLSALGPARAGGGRSRLRRRCEAASLSFGLGRGTLAADTAAGPSAEAAGAGSRLKWYLRASSRKEVFVAEEGKVVEGGGLEEEEEEEEWGGGSDAVTPSLRHREAAKRKQQRVQQVGEQGPTGRKRRRPPAYWSSDDNLRKEVVKFWAKLGVASTKVPNQTLLHFFQAHALRHGIALRGGVRDSAEWLGVQAIPGKWSLALLEDEVVQLSNSGKFGGDDVEQGPFGGGSKLIKIATRDWPSREALELGNRASATKQQVEKCSNGYWTKGTNFEKEVLTFNTQYQDKEGLPAVWMVKLVDMANNGRRDMVNAIQRGGGYDPAVERLGLVHPLEWKSFLDQLDTLRELKEFLTNCDGVLQKRMPTLTAFAEAGRNPLRKKIVLLGGRKLLARKMGLHYKPGGKEGAEEDDGLEFGRFDLGFAVDILEHVYERELRRSPVPRPPSRKVRNVKGFKRRTTSRSKFRFRPPAIVLPRREDLLAGDTKSVELVQQIEYYGGYENVARRLHLGYNYEDELRYQERVRDDLQLQNEKYGRVRERNLAQQRNKLAKLRVRLQTKRAEHEREMKLADGLRRRTS